jgi:hypothetical protein
MSYLSDFQNFENFNFQALNLFSKMDQKNQIKRDCLASSSKSSVDSTKEPVEGEYSVIQDGLYVFRVWSEVIKNQKIEAIKGKHLEGKTNDGKLKLNKISKVM